MVTHYSGFEYRIFVPYDLSVHVDRHLLAENIYVGGWFCHRCGQMFGEYEPGNRCPEGVPVCCPLPDCTIHPHAPIERT